MSHLRVVPSGRLMIVDASDLDEHAAPTGGSATLPTSLPVVDGSYNLEDCLNHLAVIAAGSADVGQVDQPLEGGAIPRSRTP